MPENFDVIGRFLTPRTLLRMELVCRAWRKQLMTNPRIWSWHARQVSATGPIAPPRDYFANPHPATAFGREEWIRYTGLDPGHVYPLPPEIHAILKAPYPFWPSECGKVCPYWIPSQVTRTIDGVTETIPITLRTLGTLIPGCRFELVTESILAEHGDLPVEKGYWILISTDIIFGSNLQPYSFQQALVKERDYEMPRIAEAILMAFLEFKRSGIYLLGLEPRVYTRCSESIDGYPLAVGDFGSAGLSASPCSGSADPIDGVLAVRRFY
jgi:hypothetical protein